MQAPKPSELTLAADELARVVSHLLPSAADPQLVLQFRAALGNLLAATLSGATVMAAGAVVALNNKVDRIAQTRGERLREVQMDVDRLSTRIHELEDAFLDDGQVGEIVSAMHRIAVDVEMLKAQAVNDEGSAA